MTRAIWAQCIVGTLLIVAGVNNIVWTSLQRLLSVVWG